MTASKQEMLTWMRRLLIIAAIATLGIVASSLQFKGWTAVSVASVGVLVAAASALVGGLLGFLFGIPRTLQSQEAPRAGGETEILANTNLEQISDWLTKILVGVGLVQLGKVGDALGRLAGSLKPALGDSASSPTAGIAIMVTFALVGFLISWLWTRIFLPGAFRAADVEAIAQSMLDKQQAADAKALALVNRVLDPPPGTSPISQEEVTEAVKAASPPTLVQIFERARKARQDSLERAKGARQDRLRTEHLANMERTALVFRALIAADAESKFHRNHGQLGFVLSDKQPPDPQEAEAELTRAISIRGAARTQGFWLYELYRAVCLIRLDEAFRQEPGAPSSPAQRQKIVDDLRVAVQLDGRARLDESPEIRPWMDLNAVSTDDLTAM